MGDRADTAVLVLAILAALNGLVAGALAFLAWHYRRGWTATIAELMEAQLAVEFLTNAEKSRGKTVDTIHEDLRRAGVLRPDRLFGSDGGGE